MEQVILVTKQEAQARCPQRLETRIGWFSPGHAKGKSNSGLVILGSYTEPYIHLIIPPSGKKVKPSLVVELAILLADPFTQDAILLQHVQVRSLTNTDARRSILRFHIRNNISYSPTSEALLPLVIHTSGLA